jgi:hypothetical protein
MYCVDKKIRDVFACVDRMPGAYPAMATVSVSDKSSAAGPSSIM